jgi:RNA-directed DNA polymerase
VNFNKQAAIERDTMERVSHGVKSNDGIGALTREELQSFEARKQEQALKITGLMQKVVAKENLEQAYKRVVSNNGAAGVDQMKVKELQTWLSNNQDELTKSLLAGTYEPTPVRRVDIPKPKGGTRQLGIPTVVDRFVQQAILQVLTPIFDPRFSESSYGFRPGRSAHQALTKAKEYVEEGRWIVVDIDLEKFFDNVNHDILMSRVTRIIDDKEMLRIIRKFLQSGIMHNGVCILQEKGTPQGGPLSPLLANVILDDLDKELERRGHKFCRYADDCNIYVYSQKAGERIMSSVEEFLTKKLKLKINHDKSQVSPCRTEDILGIHDLELWNDANLKRKHQKSQ